MDDARMKEAFAGIYLIRIDADEWEAELAKEGFDLSSIPVFFELGEDGKTTGRTVNGGSWEANTPENMAPVLGKYFRGES